jgi:glycosyltransferase involved in cell wall biosynthesis
MSISVIIPAFNEENSISGTLEHIDRAEKYLLERGGHPAEILVVDNASTDRTAKFAEASKARVVHQMIQGVAKARNTGAQNAQGDILVFVDADVTVPETLLWRITQLMADPVFIGGAVDTDYQPVRFSVRMYLRTWRIAGKLLSMAQGAVQFVRRDAFFSLGGYDETLFMGEDVDLYWRLVRHARNQYLRVYLIEDISVIPSCRRFDQWPLWRILVWTNPLVALLYRRRKDFWDGWYRHPPR